MWLGGKAGRAVGTAIGGAVAGDDAALAAGQSPGIAPTLVNDLIVTPQGQFSTHPDDYIFAMKNPMELANEMRTVGNVSPVNSPVVIDGEIQLRSELFVDDKGYRLRQSIGKNTTPYKFTVGSAQNARLIQ
jgi:hypothetical protein